MEEAKMLLLEVVIYVGVAAALFTGLDVFLALKTARGRKPKYFNIQYRYEYGAEFCRAHLVGRVGEFKNKALYLIEIHPQGRSQSVRVGCPGNKDVRRAFIEERKIL